MRHNFITENQEFNIFIEFLVKSQQESQRYLVITNLPILLMELFLRCR